MADVYIYADETGNLDYSGQPDPRGGGASTYFGFGTAVFRDDHGVHLEQGLRLRARLESEGLHLPGGFHAVNDSPRTRVDVFKVIGDQAPRFDCTFLYKANAYGYVRDRGEMYLYRTAWRLHIKAIAEWATSPGDRLFVIVGEFCTASRARQAREALAHVCDELDREIVLCVWKSVSSWGLQVADYGLWAVQRRLEQKKCTWFGEFIGPNLRTFFLPWKSAPGHATGLAEPNK